MDDELLTRFFDEADRISAEAYGLHRGRADFVCPICGGMAYVEGVRGHGAACCPTCGLLIVRGKLRSASGRDYVEAVWGIGFRLKTES